VEPIFWRNIDTKIIRHHSDEAAKNEIEEGFILWEPSMHNQAEI
jgi:hypothetical protein